MEATEPRPADRTENQESNEDRQLPQNAIPTILQRPEQPRAAWKTRFWRAAVITTLVGVVCFVVGIALSLTEHNNASGIASNRFENTVSGWLLAPLAVMAFFWLFAIIGFFLVAVRRNAKIAFAPIPPLQDIEQQLRAEGYSPTLQDVMAVEQRLKSERNGAAVVTGALLVGMHIAVRRLEGSRYSDGGASRGSLQGGGDFLVAVTLHP